MVVVGSNQTPDREFEPVSEVGILVDGHSSVSSPSTSYAAGEAETDSVELLEQDLGLAVSSQEAEEGWVSAMTTASIMSVVHQDWQQNQAADVRDEIHMVNALCLSEIDGSSY